MLTKTDTLDWNAMTEMVNFRSGEALQRVLQTEHARAIELLVDSTDAQQTCRLQGRVQQLDDILTLLRSLKTKGPIGR